VVSRSHPRWAAALLVCISVGGCGVVLCDVMCCALMARYARRPIGEDLKRLPMPVTVMFGDNDWMAHPDAPNILQAVEGPGLVTIPSAGHHLYLDNPTEFQSVLKRVTAT